VAPLALFAPPVGIIVGYVLGSMVTASIAYEGLALESTAFMTMVVFSSPLTTYWLWRRLSGREIRQHIAFGGDTQPLWKVILVLLLTGGWALGGFVFLVFAL